MIRRDPLGFVHGSHGVTTQAGQETVSNRFGGPPRIGMDRARTPESWRNRSLGRGPNARVGWVNGAAVTIIVLRLARRCPAAEAFDVDLPRPSVLRPSPEVRSHGRAPAPQGGAAQPFGVSYSRLNKLAARGLARRWKQPSGRDLFNDHQRAV